MRSKISRFNIIRVLGEGSQGVVYLAQDPILERQVAIKTINVKNMNVVKGQSLNDLLMDEAKVISKMTHPNIVSIFEAGEESDMTYLVFEYVKGQTLTEIIKSKKYQKVNDALSIFKPICEGIQHTHQHQIIHGDLKPANIILDENNVPKIMDFGIARLLANQKGDQNLYGTPRYMPPEYLQQRIVAQANDVYALGLIFFEILTGKQAIQAKGIKQIINAVLHQKIKLPSEFHNELNEVFEHIIIKSTEKQPDNRFKNMHEMLQAISQYESGHLSSSQSSKSQDAAITFLMRKIKRQQDFPALSESLVKINSMVDKDDTHAAQVANVIAEDFALTNKILKLVNSAYYRGSKPEIKTISQSVMLLGFKEIRSIAMSLMLIDHLHNKSKAKNLKNHIVSSIYSGILAKDLANEVNLNLSEEAFLSGIFHQLGELLTLYYFHEESEEIESLIKQEKISKQQASVKILGVSYEKLGIEIAKEWKLPNYIIDNIKPYPVNANNTSRILTDSNKLNSITTLSNKLSNVLEQTNDPKWRHSAVRVWREHAMELGLSDDSLKVMAEQSRKNFVDVNHIFNVNLNESEVMEKVKRLQLDEEDEDGTLIVEPTILESHTEKKEIIPEEILTQTLTAIRDEFQGSNNVTAIFKLLMNGLHEAISLERIVLCLYDPKQKIMRARMGVGISEQFLESFSFTIKQPRDLFQIACVKGVDVYINNTQDFEKNNSLPAWYRQIIDAETFMIFPVCVNNKPFALIYLDKNKKNDLVIAQQHLSMIQELRGLCVSSIEKQKQAAKFKPKLT